MTTRRFRRILMVAPRFKPAIGGVEKHVASIVDILARKGMETTILTRSHEKGLRSYEKRDNEIIVRIPFELNNNPILTYLWILWNRKKLTNFDIIHVHDTMPLLTWYLPIVILKCTQPVFMTFHGFEADPIPIIFKLLRKVARKLASRAICIGSFIEKMYNIKCEKCSIGATSQVGVTNQEREGLSFVGRLEHDTGILTHLRVLELLDTECGIRTHLTACGDGSLAVEIRKTTSEKKLDARLLGIVPNPKEFVNRSKVYLAGGYLSIIDAMSLGVPVIAFAQTNLKYQYYKSVLQAGGLISIQTTASGIALQIKRLIENPNLYQRISNEGKRFANNLTWELLTSKYFELWNDS
ncbi:MAG: glycosyltransferase family 4 protein [Candidatus Thorarchaeota archaeon]|nr:glycosyltransferase family 4 protein [Candidatus Thorarchaeota archaeon]